MTGLRPGATLVASVLLLSGCVASELEDDPSPESVPVETPRPAAGVVVQPDPSLDEMWSAVRAAFPHAVCVAGSTLVDYRPGDFPYFRAACLAAAGLGGFDESGYRVTTVSVTDQGGAAEAYLCAVRFPLSGEETVVSPLSEQEVADLFDEIRGYGSCLDASQHVRMEATARDGFRSAWPEVGTLPAPALGTANGRSLALLSRECPPPDPRGDRS